MILLIYSIASSVVLILLSNYFNDTWKLEIQFLSLFRVIFSDNTFE